MKKWQINYHELAKKDIVNIPTKLLARYYSLTHRMLDYGPNLGEPHTKSLGNDLYEIRLKAVEGIARVIYCVMIDKQIWILHSFIKKTQKIPQKELMIAETRMKELKNENR